MAVFYVGYNRSAMKTVGSPKICRLRTALVAVALLCALLAPGAPARAQQPQPGPGSIEELWARGEAAFKAGNLDEAQRLFATALASDERRARSWNYVGGVLFAQGDFPRALEHFRRALELDPGDVRACNNLGTALERLGDYAGAEEAYGRAVLVDPSYPTTQRNLGILHSRRQGDPAAARSAWRHYLELAPNGPYADEVRAALDALAAPAAAGPVVTEPIATRPTPAEPTVTRPAR
jgi:tetratricopeptide (TPR) repeat protein